MHTSYSSKTFSLFNSGVSTSFTSSSLVTDEPRRLELSWGGISSFDSSTDSDNDTLGDWGRHSAPRRPRSLRTIKETSTQRIETKNSWKE